MVATEICFAQVRTDQICLLEIDALQLCTLKVGIG
jgi:hypothetical protein